MTTLVQIMYDFASVSILLLLGFLLRKKLKIFQKYFIPVSLIAGALGLLLGPQVLGQVSPIYIPFSETVPQWSTVLFCFVFGPTFLGIKMGKINKNAISATLINGTLHQMQAVVGLVCTLIFSKTIMKSLPMGFGLLPVYGFYGGHGMANAAGVIFEESGYWSDGIGAGMTFATIGIICGVVFGMVLINKGIRKGYLKSTASVDNLDEEDLTGYIPLGKRTTIGEGVSNPSALDPLALQFALVGCVIICGMIMRYFLLKISPVMENFPIFATTFICSLIIGTILNRTKYVEYVDRNTMNRITGLALEYMIASAIATTSIGIFKKYWLPFVVISVIIVALDYILVYYMSKKWNESDWYEIMVGAFGMTMGVLATGLLLIKVIDPEYKTSATESVSIASTLGYVYQLPYTILIPLVVMKNPNLVIIISVVLLVAFFAAGEVICGRTNKNRLRE
ncbi:glutamate:Na+ symporter, ESS family [Anaerosphaera aminiphila DSM 21120]|uniref:Glutamate:Na+ symporter, ESS family n=1 Tax=Anaerosphaera aminiphila DSM 21120 TaxID=1120995 RepID=A0A1M5PMM9_9FIRM|nr:sodium/glutamate symporter [Anaerosphaera aminiphila]SHH02990.1 glutamate:Na+ symporter, ESS family [Anaerosphaera aminiphila DSM 21120]